MTSILQGMRNERVQFQALRNFTMDIFHGDRATPYNIKEGDTLTASMGFQRITQNGTKSSYAGWIKNAQGRNSQFIIQEEDIGPFVRKLSGGGKKRKTRSKSKRRHTRKN